MDIDRDSQGHEHIRATLRDHSGVKKVIDMQGTPSARSSPAMPLAAPTLGGKSTKSKAPRTTVIEEEEEIIIPDLMGTPSTVVEETREARKERQKQEKKMKRAMEKAAAKLAKERASVPAFRRLAEEFPAPRSERYVSTPVVGM
jgi:soluble lytic murein transglycosylase-like protein